MDRQGRIEKKNKTLGIKSYVNIVTLYTNKIDNNNSNNNNNNNNNNNYNNNNKSAT